MPIRIRDISAMLLKAFKQIHFLKHTACWRVDCWSSDILQL